MIAVLLAVEHLPPKIAWSAVSEVVERLDKQPQNLVDLRLVGDDIGDVVEFLHGFHPLLFSLIYI